MIHVVLSGTPYEMGYQHGQALRPLVDAIVKYELRRHSHHAPVTVDLDALLKRVNHFAPSLLEEMHGIADGAKMSFDLLLELNLRVLHFCTSIAFTQSDNGPVLGKNMDFPAYAFQVLFTVRPAEGHEMIHIGCAGSVATYGGVNSAGLAMGHAAVLLKDAGGKGSLPVAFLRRQALQHCAAVPEAIAYMSEYDPWQIGDNVLFLDQNGEAAVVELRPGTQLIHRPVNNAIWCTGCSRQPDVEEPYADGHLKRYRFIGRTLQAEEKFSSGLLRDLLSSHEGEAPICRESTQLSFLVYPVTGTLKVADGLPCQTGYTTTLQIEK